MNNLRRSVFTLSAVLLIASSHRKAYNYTSQQVGLPANSELAQLNLIRAEDTDRHAARLSQVDIHRSQNQNIADTVRPPK